MAITTWTMTFTLDFKDPQKYAVMDQMAREAGKQMMATAMLLKDSREPRIVLRTNDPFNGDRTIDIMHEPDDVTS